MALQTNPQLELAFEYVRNTNKSLFLTGKAGSGKTTFLHQIKKEGTKRLAVVAPTGVAAIHAGGMTIHSLFQLPFGLHLPGIHREGKGQQFRFSRNKIRLIRSLDLLIIDEISMVRADLLDAIDGVLRRYRDRERPFGGVQLLMIGDLYQLPPVVKPDEWEILRRYYDTLYFFSSHALQQTDYVAIELEHIYRQSDPGFIGLLNKVRDNCLDDASFRQLNSRFIAGFRPPVREAYITLTATNAAAQQINASNLAQLPGPQRVFRAVITGEFPPTAYPTEENLKFKVGAQVMFIKNDSQPVRQYFNGKIGQITRFSEHAIVVQSPGESREIEVFPADWQNLKYSLNEETKQIEEEVLGSFIQYPLKLAWAITIHKSQGLTFERAVIDAQAAFACGQVYVALSRCKSFEGIVLRSPIPRASVKTDPVVKEFHSQAERNRPTEPELWQAKRDCQADLLQELFGFDAIEEQLLQLESLVADRASLQPSAPDPLPALAERTRTELIQVGRAFAPQLAEYLAHRIMPDANERLQERIRKASCYFQDRIGELLGQTSQLVTAADNSDVAAPLLVHARQFQLALFVKRACFAACDAGFDATAYGRAKIDAELEFSQSDVAHPRKPPGVPRDVSHPELYRQLLEWRHRAAARDGRSVRGVLRTASLKELALFLPADLAELRRIPGIGKERCQLYGKELVELIATYRAQQESPEGECSRRQVRLAARPPVASETKRLSLELFRSGKRVDEIAAERHLAPTTIEGHLAHFIALGEVDIYSILDHQTVETIQQFLLAQPEAAVAEARSHFGDKYSHGVLKMVISHVLRNKVG